MSTPAVAAGAAALGFYVWLKQWQCGYASLEELPILPETHARTEAPPTTWTETFYLFKEALRYTYQETFARWHAVDLFFGLAYISRRATSNYPAADIAAAGIPLSNQQLTAPEAQGLLSELQQVRRFMLYCQGLRHHRPEQQKKHWMEHVHLRESDIIKHNPVAGLLRPAYVVIKDRTMGSIILCIRGTHSRSDMFTSLTGTVKPHHVVTSDGVVLGYSHLGMLAAARWLMASTKSTLISALQQNPDYNLKIVGHSMGAGTAALLTMMLRDKVPELATATAWAIACPACMTLQLARSCAPFVTTLVHGTDIVPTFSSGAIDKLRQEVTQSSWFADFQRDIRQQLTANFTSSMRGLRQGAAGTAQWTQRKIIRTAATSISSCYSRAPRSCYYRAPKQKPAATAGTAAQQPPAAATTVATGKASSSRIHAPSRIGRRLPGRAKASTGGAVQVSSVAGGRSSEDADAALPLVGSRAAGNASMGVAAAAASGSQQQTEGIGQPQQQRGAEGWLGRMMGFGGTHHKDAAAALPGASGSRLLLDSAATGAGGTDLDVDNTVVSEAMLVERALEACLAAVDNGQMSPSNSTGGQQTASIALAHNSRAVFPAGAALPTSAGASSSSRAAAGNLLKGVSRAILGKRPAAPGKKDDDEASNMEIEPAEAADAGGSHLPVSTAAADPAAATSSGSKPLPLSLRRRGWGWDAVFGTPGRGWVTNDDSANHSSSDAAASGGQSVVQYIRQTVGHTGKAVLQTTGQLLRGGSMFQNCAAPTAAVDGQVPHLPPRPTSKERRRRQRRKQQQQQQDPGANGSVMIAPGSSSDLMRMHRDGVASLAQESLAADAAAAGVETGSWHEHRLNSSSGGSSDGDQSLSADETLDGDSSSDPDLVDGRSGLNETDDSLMTALNMPAMQASISALMAAVGDDPEQQDLYSQAHREETLAAERSLRESNRSRLTSANMGVASEQITADPTQQQRQQQYRWQRQADAGTADSDSECLEQQPGAATEDEESSLADEQQQQHDDDDAAGAANRSAKKAAERKARRQMFPAGRVLHLMPASVVAEVGEQQQQQPAFVGMEATAVTDGVTADPAGVTPDASFQQPLQQQETANGHSAVGNEYVLLQVDSVEVYGRMRLCPTMVRDHFIPSYLRALDSVMGQLQRQLEPYDDG